MVLFTKKKKSSPYVFQVLHFSLKSENYATFDKVYALKPLIYILYLYIMLKNNRSDVKFIPFIYSNKF